MSRVTARFGDSPMTSSFLSGGEVVLSHLNHRQYGKSIKETSKVTVEVSKNKF